MAKPARQSMRDRMKEQAEKSQSHGPNYIKIPDNKKISFFQPKEGEFELDFLPYEVTSENHPKGMKPGDLWAQKSIKVHYGIGAEEKSYICPKTIGKKCPICEMRAEMVNDPTADEKLIKDLAPKDRAIYQVIDLADEKKGVQLWDYSYHLFEKRLLGDINKTENASTASGRKRSSTPHGGFADLEGGQTLIVSFIEKKMGPNKFYECDRIDAVDRDDYDENILDDTLDLDSVIEILEYDKLKAIFLAIDEKDSTAGRKGRDEEPAETSTRTRRGKTEEPAEDREPETTSRRGRRSEPEPEEKKDEEAPSRRRGRSSEPDPEPEPATTRKSRRSEPEPEPEKEETTSRPRRGAAQSDTPKCIAGGVFGKDTDSHDECYDCPDDTYAACAELKNKK